MHGVSEIIFRLLQFLVHGIAGFGAAQVGQAGAGNQGVGRVGVLQWRQQTLFCHQPRIIEQRATGMGGRDIGQGGLAGYRCARQVVEAAGEIQGFHLVG